MSVRATILPPDLGHDVLARLDVIAGLAFPDGSIGVSSLRREAARGRLTLWRVAGKDMTTLNEVRSMIERCRVQPSLPACGSGLPGDHETPSGSSSTMDVRSALAAARMRASRLKESSSNTSGRSMIPAPPRNVVPIKRP